MKRFSLVIAALLGGVVGAGAADIPQPQPYSAPAMVAPQGFNWSGLYVGVYGGYGFGTLANTGFAGQDLSLGGGMAGGTLGFNYQPPGSQLVVGAEIDAGWANITAQDSFTAFAVTLTEKTEGSATATARVRIGAAFDRLMIYGTGGGAWVRNKVTFGLSAPIVGIAGSISDTQNHMGYVAGVGLEYAFGGNWSVKGEYLYWGMSSTNYFAGTILAGPSGDFDFHTVKVGLNYRF